ncbi:hypothetical protein GGR56DRAFT_561674 [Xylariaceae sp. FL0804]|nr:hypothetical protein GGR56DRAFT_561674 [Xylariaceae sp. FL0804]
MMIKSETPRRTSRGLSRGERDARGDRPWWRPRVRADPVFQRPARPLPPCLSPPRPGAAGHADMIPPTRPWTLDPVSMLLVCSLVLFRFPLPPSLYGIYVSVTCIIRVLPVRGNAVSGHGWLSGVPGKRHMGWSGPVLPPPPPRPPVPPPSPSREPNIMPGGGGSGRGSGSGKPIRIGRTGERDAGRRRRMIDRTNERTDESRIRRDDLHARALQQGIPHPATPASCILPREAVGRLGA